MNTTERFEYEKKQILNDIAFLKGMLTELEIVVGHLMIVQKHLPEELNEPLWIAANQQLGMKIEERIRLIKSELLCCGRQFQSNLIRLTQDNSADECEETDGFSDFGTGGCTLL